MRTPLALAIIATIAAPIASSQADALDDCMHHRSPQHKLDGCTAMIESGQWQDSELAQVYHMRGIAHGHLGRYRLAVEDFDQAVHLAPRNATSYRERAVAYAGLRQYDRAIEDANRALHLAPENTLAHLKRGTFYGILGKHDAALQDLNEAIRLSPGNSEAYYNRAVVYDRMGKYDLAIADFSQTLRLNPDNARAYKNRGTAYCSSGNASAAILDWNQSIGLRGRSETLKFQRFLTTKGLYDGPINGLMDSATRTAQIAYAEAGCERPAPQ